MVALGEVGEIQSGSGFPKKHQGKSVGEHPFAKVGDISNAKIIEGKTISTAENYVDDDTLRTLRAKLFPANSVVFAKIGEAIRKNRRCITTRPMAFDNNVMGVAGDTNKVTPEFLFRYFETLDFVEFSNSTTVPSIRKSEMENLKIPLPPLAEQKRIAAILDKADALRRKRREALALLDTLTQSIFVEMFGDPVSNPKEWSVKKFSEVAKVRKGLIDPTKAEYRVLLHYGSDRISSDTGMLMPAETAEIDGVKSSKFLCEPGDILYSKIRPYLNKVAITENRVICSADVYPVIVDENECSRTYLWQMLRSERLLKYAKTCPARANIPKLNRTELEAFDLPVPTIEAQQRYETAMNKLYAQRINLVVSEAIMTSLFASLQSRAFSGAL